MAIDPNLVTTVEVSELPSSLPLLTSLMAHETVLDGSLKKMTIQQLVDLITPLVTAIQFQVITLHVDSDYIVNNFIMTEGSTKGLGINLMTGYAIVNGNNGTINKDGRVGIAYGSTYNAVGSIGGSATHMLTEAQLPSHNHLNGISDDITNAFVYGGSSTGMPGLATTDIQTGGSSRTYQGFTSTKGGGQAHSIMQPYLVELQVMKL